jgi:hypothetical protein
MKRPVRAMWRRTASQEGGHGRSDEERLAECSPPIRSRVGREKPVGPQQRGRGGEGDVLVEGGEGQQHADGETLRGRQCPMIVGHQEGECPDETGVDEDLGVRLVGLEGEVAGDHGPGGRGEESGLPASSGRRRGLVDAAERDQRSGHSEEVDGREPIPDEHLGGEVGRGDRGRIVFPEVGVELLTGTEFPGYDGIERDVALEWFAVRVETGGTDPQAEEDQHARRDRRGACESVPRPASRRAGEPHRRRELGVH